jgi:hypothetical protein
MMMELFTIHDVRLDRFFTVFSTTVIIIHSSLFERGKLR